MRGSAVLHGTECSPATAAPNATTRGDAETQCLADKSAAVAETGTGGHQPHRTLTESSGTTDISLQNNLSSFNLV